MSATEGDGGGDTDSGDSYGDETGNDDIEGENSNIMSAG